MGSNENSNTPKTHASKSIRKTVTPKQTTHSHHNTPPIQDFNKPPFFQTLIASDDQVLAGIRAEARFAFGLRGVSTPGARPSRVRPLFLNNNAAGSSKIE